MLVINWQDWLNPYAGGAEVHLHEIFKRITEKGHKVTLLCSKFKGGQKRLIKDGIQIIRAGRRNTFNFYTPSFIKKHGDEFDIIIDDINKIPFYSPLFYRKKILAIVHHLFGKSIFNETGILSGSYVYLSEKLIPYIYRNNKFIAVSESTKNDLINLGIKEENIYIVHNAVSKDMFVKKFPEKDKNLISYLGRLKKYKRIKDAIDAFEKLSQEYNELKLVIIGDGDYRGELLRYVMKKELGKRILFTGFVSGEEKRLLLSRSIFTVNPSIKEGWGLTVIESNATYTPVIAANSPGLRDAVKDNETGILFKTGDVNALYSKMKFLIDNEDVRKQLSLNARKWAEKFSWNISSEKILQIVEKIINEE